MKDCNGNHEKVVVDKFAKIQGVSRSVPGDCFCLDCGQPLPAWWNRGKPELITESDDG